MSRYLDKTYKDKFLRVIKTPCIIFLWIAAFMLLYTVLVHTKAHAQVISNLNVSNNKAYKVPPNGLQPGDKPYIDREYEFKNLPLVIQNARYIQTANNDKQIKGDTFLSFDVKGDVVVYIALDNRVPEPTWMQDFIKTPSNLSVEGAGTFNLYQASFSNTRINLGGNQASSSRSSMYMVMVVTTEGLIEECGIHPSISWDSNKETDLALYNFYSHTTPNVMRLGSVLPIPHLGKDIALGNGDKVHAQGVYSFPVGPVYFGITAVDQSGNESELSDVMGCLVKKPEDRTEVTDKFSLGLTIEGE